MQIYYPSFLAIEQQTRQLDHAQCAHCQQTNQLISHGFIRKKRLSAEPQAVGKRVFCSNRNRRTGCGRTMQLYLDSTIRYLHHAGSRVAALVLSLIAGATIQQAYYQATRTSSPRHADRWLHRLRIQNSTYRRLLHQPPLQDVAPIVAIIRPAGLVLLIPPLKGLFQRFGPSLCAAYQLQWQQPFL
ncbi:hypothetical protein HZU77_014835 [Neisseriaceae bacterium TC5R-5]|nr:hypothetical protein [Neisseriaceae bacterium TC5R-5]